MHCINWSLTVDIIFVLLHQLIIHYLNDSLLQQLSYYPCHQHWIVFRTATMLLSLFTRLAISVPASPSCRRDQTWCFIFIFLLGFLLLPPPLFPTYLKNHHQHNLCNVHSPLSPPYLPHHFHFHSLFFAIPPPLAYYFHCFHSVTLITYSLFLKCCCFYQYHTILTHCIHLPQNYTIYIDVARSADMAIIFLAMPPFPPTLIFYSIDDYVLPSTTMSLSLSLYHRCRPLISSIVAAVIIYDTVVPY